MSARILKSTTTACYMQQVTTDIKDNILRCMLLHMMPC